MSIRKFNFVPNEYYHIYNRATDKRNIYLDNADYQRFLTLLYLCNSSLPVNVRDILNGSKSVYKYERGEQLVSIGVYCLMPNHFHLLVTPLSEEGVAKFMNKLGTSYSMYFNKKYERSGNLFQGRFKAQLAIDDTYLKYLFSYIHLNPVKLIKPDWKENGVSSSDEIMKFLELYQASSLLDYLGHDREVATIIDKEAFPRYFETINDTQDELFEWLNFKDTESNYP